jgi:hypothetical protein
MQVLSVNCNRRRGSQFIQCIQIQYSKTNAMHFLCSIYCELTASTYFEHYLLSSGAAAKTILGILRACYVCWLLPGLEWNWSTGPVIPSVVCVAPPEDEQVMLETYRGC